MNTAHSEYRNGMSGAAGQLHSRSTWWALLLAAGVLLGAAHSAPVSAGAAEQAKRIHDRLTGAPPSSDMLDQMVALIQADGNGASAAALAIDNDDNDDFYNVTLKNWAAPWTNRDQDVFVPLNDYIATAIGFVRDERDFREVLYANTLYVGAGSLGLPPYSIQNNNHYEALEAGLERNGEQGASLKDDLVAAVQSDLTGLPPESAAGVITSRAASRAFFIAGTNRAQFRFTLINHLCMDLEQVHDTTRVPDRIRQDVSRSPGGDARVFLNNCIGCHSGMDPLTQAFAYHNFNVPDFDNDPTGANGSNEYTAGVVQPKYFNNDTTFPPGYVTPDDHWDNYWRAGKNVNLGWDESLPGSGIGAASMLQELAHSQAFAQCHVQRAFETVCLRAPQDAGDRAQVSAMIDAFNGDGHNLKRAFISAADYCKGE